jgi:FRG domain
MRVELSQAASSTEGDMAYFDFAYWNEFLNDVRTAEERLGNPPVVWYRGVSDERHNLRPSLLRRANGVALERDLFTKYKMLATLVHEARGSDWELLFDMQHYRIPTRLLDWTEVLGIAVFFALLSNKDTDAAIYLLNPLAVNLQSSKRNIPLVSEENDFDYKQIYWEHKPVPPVHPIAIQAPAQNNRILAQRGKFTVHGTDDRPLEEQFPDLVQKVPLGDRVKEGAREYLRISGINEFSVFPDIVGLAPFLEAIVGIKP